MPTFGRSITICKEPMALFRLTQDYTRRLEWDPFLQEARLVGGAVEPGVGVRAWCVARNGLAMETEYVSYRPPEMAAVRMTAGPRALATFAGSWRFKQIAPGVTYVTFCYHLTAWPSWLRFILDPILLRVFAADTWQRLVALKRAAETTSLLQEYEFPQAQGGP
ncbi:MAG TPA: SRPBCC family protein [Ktedonobacterales bacterium]|jgi:hypothetical protein